MSQGRQGDGKSPVLAIDPSLTADTAPTPPAASRNSAPLSPGATPKVNRSLQATIMAPAPIASVATPSEQQRPSSNGTASRPGSTSSVKLSDHSNGRGVVAAAAVQGLNSKDLVRPLTVRMEPPIITDVTIEVANSHPFHSVAAKLKYTYHHNRWCLTPDGEQELVWCICFF